LGASTGGAATRVAPYAMGVFAALVAFAVHDLTDDLYVHAMELQFALYVACALAISGAVGTAGRIRESS
jgi:hypothetical protein